MRPARCALPRTPARRIPGPAARSAELRQSPAALNLAVLAPPRGRGLLQAPAPATRSLAPGAGPLTGCPQTLQRPRGAAAGAWELRRGHRRPLPQCSRACPAPPGSLPAGSRRTWGFGPGRPRWPRRGNPGWPTPAGVAPWRLARGGARPRRCDRDSGTGALGSIVPQRTSLLPHCALPLPKPGFLRMGWCRPSHWGGA